MDTETSAVGASAPAALLERSCVTCGKPLPKRTGRGQPPKYCAEPADCRRTAEAAQLKATRARARARANDPALKREREADRLERMADNLEYGHDLACIRRGEPIPHTVRDCDGAGGRPECCKGPPTMPVLEDWQRELVADYRKRVAALRAPYRQGHNPVCDDGITSACCAPLSYADRAPAADILRTASELTGVEYETTDDIPLLVKHEAAEKLGKPRPRRCESCGVGKGEHHLENCELS